MNKRTLENRLKGYENLLRSGALLGSDKAFLNIQYLALNYYYNLKYERRVAESFGYCLGADAGVWKK